MAQKETFTRRRITEKGWPLTKRQKEVMDLICQGLEDKEIARILGGSHRTVNTHVSTAYLRLGAKNRVHGAVLYDRMQRRKARAEADKSLSPEMLTN